MARNINVADAVAFGIDIILAMVMCYFRCVRHNDLFYNFVYSRYNEYFLGTFFTK